MLLLGLTGGIATGKSTVCQFLQSELKLPIVDADLIARQVVRPGRPAYKKIIQKFGTDILQSETREINREKLGDIIFGDPAKRRLLNQCTHPYIRQTIVMQILYYWISGHSIIVLDAPLLYESRLDKWMSKVMVVRCSDDKQLSRLVERSGLTEKQARQRIDAQMPLDEKCRLASFVVDNDGELRDTFAQCRDIINQIAPSLFQRISRCLLFIPVASVLFVMAILGLV